MGVGRGERDARVCFLCMHPYHLICVCICLCCVSEYASCSAYELLSLYTL